MATNDCKSCFYTVWTENGSMSFNVSVWCQILLKDLITQNSSQEEAAPKGSFFTLYFRTPNALKSIDLYIQAMIKLWEGLWQETATFIFKFNSTTTIIIIIIITKTAVLDQDQLSGTNVICRMKSWFTDVTSL